MALTSPAAHRVAAILNFFAAHTDQAFTLTEVVRALKMSRGTCHNLLLGLTEVGYLHRSHGKGYTLGPNLVSLARTVSTGHTPLQIAHPEMRALANEFGGLCLAIFREGASVVTRQRVFAGTQPSWGMPLGSKLPLRPPYGAILYSRSPKADVDAWLANLDPPATAEHRAIMFETMLFVREHGFLFGVHPDGQIPDRISTEWFMRGEVDQPPVVPETQLDPRRHYKLAFVSAPVLESPHAVAFEMNVCAAWDGKDVSGAEVARIGRIVREACGRVSAFLSSTPARSP